MQVHQQRAVCSCGLQHVRDQLAGDRHAWTVFAVLPRIPVVRHDHRDAPRRGTLQRVDHDHQLEQVPFHRRAGRLQHEHVRAAHIFQQLKMNFAIRKVQQLGLSHWHTKKGAHLFAQWLVRRSAENFEPLIVGQPRRPLALRCRRGRCLAAGRRAGDGLRRCWTGLLRGIGGGERGHGLLRCHVRRENPSSRLAWVSSAAECPACLPSQLHLQRATETDAGLLAGRPGFEPGQSAPKALDLPLVDRPTPRRRRLPRRKNCHHQCTVYPFKTSISVPQILSFRPGQDSFIVLRSGETCITSRR